MSSFNRTVWPSKSTLIQGQGMQDHIRWEQKYGVWFSMEVNASLKPYFPRYGQDSVTIPYLESLCRHMRWKWSWVT